MHEAVEQPLDVDLDPPARGEVVEPLIALQVGKDRLVDLAPHPCAESGGAGNAQDGEAVVIDQLII
ncbi:MAG TPA: hypothetical protein VGF73_10620 [Chthoniobacterales bacterium]